jgi:hypothetical protein
VIEGTPRTYWLYLLTGKTWREFVAAGAAVCGFRVNRCRTVHRMRQGDYLLCYLTGASRFVGVVEVAGEPYEDTTPISQEEGEALSCRVPVRVVAQLTPETGVPVKELRDRLSMFQDMKSPNAWTGPFRRTAARWREADGQAVVEAIRHRESGTVAERADGMKLEAQPQPVRSEPEPVTLLDQSIPDATRPTNLAARAEAAGIVKTTAPTEVKGPSPQRGNVQRRGASGPVVRFGRPPITARSNWDIRDWSLAQINAYVVEHFSARLVTTDRVHPSPGEAGARQQLDRERLRIALLGTRWDRDVQVMADRIIAAYERLGG